MQELYDIKDDYIKELKKYKGKEITTQSLEIVDTLVHTIKNLCKVIEDCEKESYGRHMSMNYGTNYGVNNMNPNYGYMPEMYGAQGRGPGAARDSMGRYAAGNDMMSELNSLAMSMPDEQSRQAIQNIMSKYR